MIEINENNDELRLIFHQPKTPKIAIGILLGLAIISFVAPIGVLALIGSSTGIIGGFVVFILIGVYFSRMYLWNSRGKEILEINQKTITHILDYGLFKETNEIQNEAANFQFELASKDKNFEKELGKDILDTDHLNQSEEGFIYIYNELEEPIMLNSKIKISDLKSIKNQISKRLNQV